MIIDNQITEFVQENCFKFITTTIANIIIIAIVVNNKIPTSELWIVLLLSFFILMISFQIENE